MARVLKPFRDRETWMAYAVGDDWNGTPERLRTLCDGGYVETGLVANECGENAADAPTAAQKAIPDYSAMTNEQLRALCAERGVEAPRRATKARLLSLLKA